MPDTSISAFPPRGGLAASLAVPPPPASGDILPIALAVLSALGVIPPDFLDRYIVMGELALDGSLLSVSGALPAAMAANAREWGL